MKTAKLVLFLMVVIAGTPSMQAVTPIKVVRQPFSNGEAIKLDFQAQEQMKKGDLAR